MGRFENKVGVVTGSASGIGRAIVEKLVAEGAVVLATDINRSGGVDALAAELGERCVPLTMDVSREDHVERTAELVRSRFGRLDMAFNVAGASKPGTLLGSSVENWRFGLDLCVVGTFICMKHEARVMIDTGVKGAIVNVSSMNAEMPAWGLGSYCAAKAAVVMLAKSGSIELSEHGIRVNTVSPGITSTPMNGAMPAPMLDAYLERIPMNRVARVEGQVEACLFLASEAASYITGTNLVVDGGWANSGYPDMRPWLGPVLNGP